MTLTIDKGKMPNTLVIVGGGVAGLATAYYCLKANATWDKITILERSDRFGGRVHTIRESGYYYESGAGRVSSAHHRLLSLLKDFNIGLLPITIKRRYVGIKDTDSSKHTDLIKIILQCSDGIPDSRLKQMTFGELALECVGADKAKHLQNVFGYDAEFRVMNAYDGCRAFKTDFKTHTKYYRVEGGFDRLIQELVSYLTASKKVSLLTRSSVISIDGTTLRYLDASSREHTITPTSIVCAVPQASLLELFPEEKSVLSSVVAVPLNRLYGFVDPTWLQGQPVTTTDNSIRMFVPINMQSGLSMISYTDSMYAKYWHRHPERIYKKLAEIFPDCPEVKDVRSHYWDAGVHYWKKGVDSQVLQDRILHLKGNHVPTYVVGETYSMHQAWVEGALESVEHALKSMQRQGGAKQMTKQELADLRKEGVLYVLLEDKLQPNMLRVVDVTQWQKQHPGGSWPYQKHAYKNATSAFNSIQTHFKNGEYSPWVQQVLRKYTLGYTKIKVR